MFHPVTSSLQVIRQRDELHVYPRQRVHVSGLTREPFHRFDRFFARFGDFERADPDDMHGIAAVPLAELARDLGRDLGGRNAADDDEFPLNRVFEVRGVFDGAVNGFLGVEAGVVNDRVRAQRQ